MSILKLSERLVVGLFNASIFLGTIGVIGFITCVQLGYNVFYIIGNHKKL